MMKKFLFIGAILLAGCVPDPENIELARYMLVQTEYNQDFINDTDNVFENYGTFVMDDVKMGFVSTLDPEKEYLEEADVPDFVTPVLNKIRDKFEDKGYVKVTDDDEPDFAVNVVVLENFNFYQSINYGYGYPGSYYGYYGYYYPYVSTYYANYVTLVIQVVDAKNPNGQNQYPIIWTAYIGDLVFTNDLTTKTLEAVDKAFEQSPYILTKN